MKISGKNIDNATKTEKKRNKKSKIISGIYANKSNLFIENNKEIRIIIWNKLNYRFVACYNYIIRNSICIY